MAHPVKFAGPQHISHFRREAEVGHRLKSNDPVEDGTNANCRNVRFRAAVRMIADVTQTSFEDGC